MSLPKNIDPGKTNPELGPINLRDSHPVTQCARITGNGRSAIAVVLICGKGAGEILSRCFIPATKSRFSPSEIRYGVWAGPHGETSPAESVVMTPLGDNRFEVHCHGGPAATERIIEDMRAAGATPIQPYVGDQDSENLLIREATNVLTRCVTVRTAAIAMSQVRGALRDWAEKRLKSLGNDEISVRLAKQSAEEILRSVAFTTRLCDPWRVVLLGPANVGKSSLLNAIVGFDRSITLDMPGTTRDVLHADTVIDGLPIQLSDTAGIRESEESIEKQGIARAQSAALKADLVLSVSEPSISSPWTSEVSPSWIRVLNKLDLMSNINSYPNADIATNALTGEGVEQLMALIADKLSRRMPRPGEPAAVNDRQASLLRGITEASDANQITIQLRELLDVNAGDR